MPSAVENRVVSMEFNNSKFGTKVQETLGWLKKLEEGLQLSKAQSGLKGISSAAQQVDLGTLANKVDQVGQHFTGLQAIGTGALLAIGNAAVAAAQKMVSNMTAVIIATGTMTISIFDTTSLFLIDIFLSTDILLF